MVMSRPSLLPDAEADRPSSWLARHSSDKPYRQGDLDGLCGIYAVVNALLLLTAKAAPWTRTYSRSLFRRGVAMINAKGDLDAVILDGMAPERWFKLVEALAEQVASDLRLDIHVDRLETGSASIRFPLVQEAIEAALARDALVLVLLDGVHQHYTVIASHTPQQFLLYDSLGLRRLTKQLCGNERSNKRHRIASRWVVILEVTA
ncbi:hypothetical protein CA235_17320 [Sphingomonas sp. ABOLF]|nr:hypothetical protein CA235_17320 [Sphingomonas sp. ABOLF]